ncbi:ciliary microtubule inner protein 2B-like [Symsagittifera roscoffensis]|uniref:ciliary microtubule inner protein 2B-like n=1 Tax=Symsagittifera roscoffensis TaxID=84072 RepID=UPI00307B7831
MTSTLDLLSTNPKHVLTVNDRSHFADLKEGSMVPGYRGYIPKYKFHEGYTYGQGTHEMYKIRLDDLAKDGLKHTGSLLPPVGGITRLQRSVTLPPADGVNKLTEDMKPGYTGYVPRRPFIFGGTYRSECDDCVEEFLGTKGEKTAEKERLEAVVKSYPKLHPITRPELVVKKLNHLKDHKEGAPAIAEDKRTGTEAPIPGYTGFVPRTHVTETGLGGRYHVTSEKGFRDFFKNSMSHASTLGLPIDKKSLLPGENEVLRMGVTGEDMDRRLYHQTGMLPKYTGYLPHGPYAFGKTYGNMSRSLSVCGHDFPTYGMHKANERRNKPTIKSARQ